MLNKFRDVELMEGGVGAEEMGQSKVRRLEEMDNPSLWLCFSGDKSTNYAKKEKNEIETLHFCSLDKHLSTR